MQDREGKRKNLTISVFCLELIFCFQQLQNNGATATVPVVQTITNLISTATNPIQLAKMGELYHPWF